MVRWNGSIQSSNVPSYNKTGIPRNDYAMYRCMVTKVLYADDPQNITKSAQNPEVVYDVVILGGHATGQAISNCRLGSLFSGGDYGYDETILKATTKDLSKVKLSDHDGDVVMVQFIQGHDGYPIIIGYGKGLHNTTAANKADGPRKLSEYNGLKQEINNTGEYTITRKGGSVVNGAFIAGTTAESSIALEAGETIEIKTISTGKFKIVADKIAIGANGIELLQKISDQLLKLQTWATNVGAVHTHTGNLGYLVTVPTQSADYTTLGSDLGEIKAAIDSIKGSL